MVLSKICAGVLIGGILGVVYPVIIGGFLGGSLVNKVLGVRDSKPWHIIIFMLFVFLGGCLGGISEMVLWLTWIITVPIGMVLGGMLGGTG